MSSQIVFRIAFGVVMLGLAVFAGRQVKDPALDRAVGRAPTDWERAALRHFTRWATIFLLAMFFVAEVVSRDGPLHLVALIIVVPSIVTVVYRRGIRDGREHSASHVEQNT